MKSCVSVRAAGRLRVRDEPFVSVKAAGRLRARDELSSTGVCATATYRITCMESSP